MTTLQSRIGIAVTLALVTILSVSAVAWYIFPRIHTTRESIDTSRANIQALVLQQRNLVALQQQKDQVSAAAAQVQSEVWSFDTEDAFYSTLQRIASQAHVTSEDPKVSDATPTGKYQVRTVSIVLTGTTANLLEAVNQIEKTQPVIALTSTAFLTSGASTQLTLTAKTVWQ